MRQITSFPVIDAAKATRCSGLGRTSTSKIQDFEVAWMHVPGRTTQPLLITFDQNRLYQPQENASRTRLRPHTRRKRHNATR